MSEKVDIKEINKIPSLFGDEFTLEVVLTDGNRHELGQFKDEESAMVEFKKFEKREFGEPDVKHNVLPPHEWIKAFQMKKNPFDKMTSGDFEENEKKYSQYMVEQHLSMSIENVPVLGHIATKTLSNYAHAAYLSEVVKKPKRYAKYIKADKVGKQSAKDKELIQEAMDEFNLSPMMAEEYCKLYNLVNDK